MTGTTEHPTPEALSRYVDRALTAGEAADCAYHLAECDACHETAEALRDVGRLIRRGAPAPDLSEPCPTPDRWDGFVADGSQPNLEAHLAACPDCRALLARDRLGARETAPPPAAPGQSAGPGALVCFRCRADLGETDRFCPKCGAQITARTGTSPLMHEGPGAWFTHLWLGLSLAALGASFVWHGRFYQCLVVALGSFLLWLHLRNPVRQYLDILTALHRGDSARADAILENVKRRLGGG